MAFQLTTFLLNYIDNTMTSMVATNVSTITSFITPIIGIGMAITLMIEGLMMILNPGYGDGLSSLLARFVKWAVILSVATAGGLYQQEYINAAMHVPDELAKQIVIANNPLPSAAGQGSQLGNMIDTAADEGLDTVKEAFKHAGFMTSAGVAAALTGICLSISLAFMLAISAAIVAMTKILMGITLCIGPIFILALMFQATSALFTKWLGSVIKYGMTLVLLSLVIGLLLKFYGNEVKATSPGSGTEVWPALLACAIVTIVSWFILKEVPTLAAALGDGVTIAARNVFGSGGGGSATGGGGASTAFNAGRAGGQAVAAAMSGAGPAGLAASAGMMAARSIANTADKMVRGLANK